jgi:hypothetical protein
MPQNLTTTVEKAVHSYYMILLQYYSYGLQTKKRQRWRHVSVRRHKLCGRASDTANKNPNIEIERSKKSTLWLR